nr:MAG TPA: hypothetical protein [Caudoviricetes sp.]
MGLGFEPQRNHLKRDTRNRCSSFCFYTNVCLCTKQLH